MSQIGNFANKINNPFYDNNASATVIIYVSSERTVLPCKPMLPFTEYFDDFTVMKHSSGKVKLVGDTYSIFKNENTRWNWCCTKRTTSSKSNVLAQSQNEGYILPPNGATRLDKFDFNNPPSI